MSSELVPSPVVSVMLDLETYGTQPGSVIRAIGAVKFSDGKILDEFYQRVDPQSCVQHGLKLDVATVEWWLQRSDDARQELVKPGVPLPVALECFSIWFGTNPETDVWGNGAIFDNALLIAAFQAVGRRWPWADFRDRCYRTVKKLWPSVPLIRTGTHHNALDDARDQALHLMELLGPR